MKEPSHILVVDDDDRIRDLVRRFLHKQGHRVTVARDAATARRLLITFDFDLIVLDIMMPGEDGLSLLKHLRERRSTPVIPRFITTSATASWPHSFSLRAS